MNKKNLPIIDLSILEAICKIIGDTGKGLTNTEIDRFLADSQIADIDSGNTKWKRLYNAFINYQKEKECSNKILLFIQKAINPARYLDREEEYEDLLYKLNKSLSFIGIELKNTGKYIDTETSATISDAEKKANKLKKKLEYRNAHPDIFKYCDAELLVNNYFHAVFEATKSVADKIRNKTGLTDDGSSLVNKAFSIKNPLLKINPLSTETDRSEHNGFANLLRGMFGMFRNTTGHAPKITWEIDEDDALDMLAFISLMHRRLDNSF